MSDNVVDLNILQKVLDESVLIAKENHEGHVADYIPELASANPERTAITVMLKDGAILTAGDSIDEPITLQSAAKLILLIGLLEELGPKEIMKWVKAEPSTDDFASIAHIDQFSPRPSNPLLNSGAITLCAHIPGNKDEQLQWLENWAEKLFNEKLILDQKVFESERRTGDRNRALAYLLKSQNLLTGDVDEVLDTFFSLCSFQATVKQAAMLPMLLANGGETPDGIRVFSRVTARTVVAIMSTCGINNETGAHMVRTGLPAKSSMSGFILATALHHGGVAVYSPKVNRRGTSMRGEIILAYLSRAMTWHFAN